MNDSNKVKPGVGLKIVFLALAAAGIGGGLLLRATAPDPEALPPALAQAPVVASYRLSAPHHHHRPTGAAARGGNICRNGGTRRRGRGG